jgi:predicted CXXCH cytochrome family protein
MSNMGEPSLRDKLETFLAAIVLVGFGLLVHLSKAKDKAQSSHQQADCAICHTTVADIAGEATAFIDPSAKCRICHVRLDDLSGPELTFHNSENRRCLDCHNFHSPNEIIVGDRVFHAESSRPAQRALCSSCHGVGEDVRMLSKGHRAAAGLFHSDYRLLAGLSPSEACMVCHSDQVRSETVITLTANSIPTLQQHGNHPTGVSVILGRQLTYSRIRTSLDPDIQLFGGRVECQTCHSLSSGTQFNLIAGSDRNSLCLKCHDMG